MPASRVRVRGEINCALDVAMSNGGAEVDASEVAYVMGISTRQVRRIVRSARLKIAANPDAVPLLQRMNER